MFWALTSLLVIPESLKSVRAIMAPPQLVTSFQSPVGIGLINVQDVIFQESIVKKPCRLQNTSTTKYPNISKEHFANKGVQVDAIKLNGSMELAPSLNMCRRIVDLVSTGATLKANGLKEIEEIMKVQSKLIINRSSFKTDNKKIQSIIEEFKDLVE